MGKAPRTVPGTSPDSPLPTTMQLPPGPQATQRPLPHPTLYPLPPWPPKPQSSDALDVMPCTFTFLSPFQHLWSTPSWPLWWAPLLAKFFASFHLLLLPVPPFTLLALPHPNPNSALPQQLLPAPPLPLGFHDNLVGHSVLSPPLTALLLSCLHFSCHAPPALLL